jgi:hypothetical protein
MVKLYCTNPLNEDDFKILKVEEWKTSLTYHKWNISTTIWDEIRGKLRGNLECGSAQPSLFHLFSNVLIVLQSLLIVSKLSSSFGLGLIYFISLFVLRIHMSLQLNSV